MKIEVLFSEPIARPLIFSAQVSQDAPFFASPSHLQQIQRRKVHRTRYCDLISAYYTLCSIEIFPQITNLKHRHSDLFTCSPPFIRSFKTYASHPIKQHTAANKRKWLNQTRRQESANAYRPNLQGTNERFSRKSERFFVLLQRSTLYSL